MRHGKCIGVRGSEDIFDKHFFVAKQGFESYGTGPTVRTTDDYLREREAGPPRPSNEGSE